MKEILGTEILNIIFVYNTLQTYVES